MSGEKSTNVQVTRRKIQPLIDKLRQRHEDFSKPSKDYPDWASEYARHGFDEAKLPWLIDNSGERKGATSSIGEAANDLLKQALLDGAFDDTAFDWFRTDRAYELADDLSGDGLLRLLCRGLERRDHNVIGRDPNPLGRLANALEAENRRPRGRRGRLPKSESEALKLNVLAKASQSPGLARDFPALASLCGTSEKTVRRIIKGDLKRNE